MRVVPEVKYYIPKAKSINEAGASCSDAKVHCNLVNDHGRGGGVEPRDVSSDVLAVSPSILVWAAGCQGVIPTREVDELYRCPVPREKIAWRVARLGDSA